MPFQPGHLDHPEGRDITMFIRRFDFYLIAYMKDNIIWQLKDKDTSLDHIGAQLSDIPISHRHLGETRIGYYALEMAFERIWSRVSTDRPTRETIHSALFCYVVMVCETARSRLCCKEVYSLVENYTLGFQAAR